MKKSELRNIIKEEVTSFLKESANLKEAINPKFKLIKAGKFYRIQALKKLPGIKIGDLGGFVETEQNLSHDGNCWINHDAKVIGKARVFGNAMIESQATIMGAAKVYDNARVFNRAIVSGNAEIFGNAEVSEDAKVHGFAKVYNNASIYGKANVYDNAEISGNATISGEAMIFGTAKISKNATVNHRSIVKGDAVLPYKGRSRMFVGTLDSGNEFTL